ncbi:MAG: GH3 auxin-responsive promoter family protein [Chloroflexi bacterium]|nr:GH3 auxin-responsive promoter family protein [Chloroflexota bacterium]
MLGKRESREDWDTQRLWERYCGFLDLSLDSFMDIQEQLLLEQLQLLAGCSLGRELFGAKPPTSLQQFRERVPFTYGDAYRSILEDKDESALPQAPVVWAHTSDDGGAFKQVPYTQRAFDRLIDHTVAGAVLAAARHRGDYSLPRRPKTLFHIPPQPYLTALIAQGLYDRDLFSPVIPLEKGAQLGFVEKITVGFNEALRVGVDVIGSKSSILVRMGEGFAEASQGKGLPPNAWRPSVAARLLQAFTRSRIEHRPILPKDLWPSKAILCWGTDTDLYRERIAEYWGQYPFELLASTEMGILAMQNWRKKAMTFVPDSAFLEFIPEAAWLESRRDPDYAPQTVLLNELQPGNTYELVITSFHGMPFVRYRVGFLVKVEAAEDVEARVALPQITLVDRCDSIIDLAGFTRLGERSIIRALEEAGIRHTGWFITKDKKPSLAALHLYIEVKDTDVAPKDVAAAIQQGLMKADPFYRDLNLMLGPHPIQVTLLAQGAFQTYEDAMARRGEALTERRPSRVNPPDIQDILRLIHFQPA